MSQFAKGIYPYGAPLGRSTCPHLDGSKVRVWRVNIDSGGYDDGGAYWGLGSPLYCAEDDGDFRIFLRACDRANAQLELAARFPGIVFARKERT